MSWRNSKLWIGAFSCLAVGLVAVVDVRRTAPGELAIVHSRVPELAERDSCTECHGGWRTSMRSACLDCHEVIAAHLESDSGLHGILEDDLAARCALCHSEHHGAGFGLVNATSFRLAGVDERDAFDHELVGWPMAGKHLELGCVECHEHADEPILAEGAHRFVGLSNECVTCHEDPHEGALTIGCAQCHDQSSFQTIHSDGHDERLELIGGHADISCRECHAENDAHALEVIAGLRDRPAARTCVSCHESPHQESFIAGVASLERLGAGQSCIVCHEAPHTSFQEETLSISEAQHAASGFPLDAPHDAQECENCHGVGVIDFATGAGAGASFAERFSGRTADQCGRCHEDVHRGQFDHGAFAGKECSACHEPLRFEPHAFTVELHERTALPLVGSHVSTECEACHIVPAGGEDVRRFHGTPETCDECHEDAHRGFFDERLASALEPSEAGDCARCHQPTSFAESLDFDHADWTSFAVDGAHAQSDCESCHARSASADEQGRTFGFVHEVFGDFEGCATCHEDPHGGGFDRPGLPSEVEGRRDCARCHRTSSFRWFDSEFEHGVWTGFELRGAHAAAACSACHAPVRGAAPGTRTWEPAVGSACSACHESVHGDQFVEPDGREDCARCHSDATAFASLVFDHDRDSRFPLDDAHEKVACSACHPPIEADGAPESDSGRAAITRYRPLGRECSDCHGVKRDELRGARTDSRRRDRR